jgi:pimeloyl-ACP methyl ester carboxylesterase
MTNHIRSTKIINPKNWNGKTILYMHGYYGFIWEASRHLGVLKEEGYKIVAMDFNDILKRHNPSHLLELIDQVDEFIEKENLINDSTLVIGLSLGGLVGFSLIKRHRLLNKLFIITGGDITHIPMERSLKHKWKLTRKELAAKWKKVNLYTPVGEFRNKNITMLLPKRDRVINPDEVVTEINKHRELNNISLVRTPGGHLRTIITETILAPRRSLSLINELAEF